MDTLPPSPAADALADETPLVDWRTTCHRINGAERWFVGVRGLLPPQDALLFNELLAVAYKPAHADYLADYARELVAALDAVPEHVTPPA